MGDAERFQIVRPLGADASGFVARDTSVTPPRLVVLERVTRPSLTAQEREQILGRVRAVQGFEHPKVVPVRESIEREGDTLVVSDFVDGEWLSALFALDPRPPVAVLLRSVLDVLEGLASLHDLKDGKGQSLKFVHGALSPDSVLVADDGVAEIAHICSGPPSKRDRFVAPELRRGEPATEVQADIYSVGALLREVLAAATAEAKWAEALTDIAWRACSVDPENRWPSAIAMATAYRRIAGSKLATSGAVAAFLREHFGARMRARRAALDMLDTPDDEQPPPSSGEPISLRESEMMVIDPPSVPTLPDDERQLPPSRAAVARVALVKKPSAMARSGVDLLDIPEPVSEVPTELVKKRGISAMAPPMGMTAPPAPSKKPSLPPPDIVPDVPAPPKKVSLPPPDIVPDVALPPSAARSVPPSSAAYRARLPTFPIKDVPPKRSFGVQAMAIAAALVTTFGVGWWLGRNHPPPADLPQAAAAPLTVTAVETAPPKPPVTSVPPVASSSVAGVASAAVSASAAAAPSAAAPPSASAAATSSVPAWAMAPRPTPTYLGGAAVPTTPPSPAPASTPTAGGTSTPTAATTTATATASQAKPAVPVPPRPSGSAGYVPSEL